MDSVAMKHHRLKEEGAPSDGPSVLESPALAPSDPPSPMTRKRIELENKDKAFVLEHSINLQLDVEHQIEILAVKKSKLPAWKIMFLATLSGFWMSLSGCFAYSVAGGIEKNIVKAVPVLPKLVLALLAPVAMHFIVIFGGEFYSGNCMFMFVGYLTKRLTLRTLLYNWVSCFWWNMFGCVVGVWLFGYATDLFSDDPQLTYIIELTVHKSEMNPWIVFLRAIPANFMICLSIQMGISARDMLGKLIVLHMPLTVYTVAGFEHAIGNLVIFPLGLMYGANASIWGFLLNNLIPATIGNAIGGCMIAYIETLLFSWDQGLGNTNQVHNHTDARKRAHSKITLQKGNALARTKLEATRAEIERSMEELSDARQQLKYLGAESPQGTSVMRSPQAGGVTWGRAGSWTNGSSRNRSNPASPLKGPMQTPSTVLERYELSVDDGIRGGSYNSISRANLEKNLEKKQFEKS